MRSILAPPGGMPLDFDSVVTSERPGLARYFQHAVHDVGLAEDLTQEAFLRAARNVPSLRLILAGDGSLRPYLIDRIQESGLADRIWLPAWPLG